MLQPPSSNHRRPCKHTPTCVYGLPCYARCSWPSTARRTGCSPTDSRRTSRTRWGLTGTGSFALLVNTCVVRCCLLSPSQAQASLHTPSDLPLHRLATRWLLFSGPAGRQCRHDPRASLPGCARHCAAGKGAGRGCDPPGVRTRLGSRTLFGLSITKHSICAFKMQGAHAAVANVLPHCSANGQSPFTAARASCLRVRLVRASAHML